MARQRQLPPEVSGCKRAGACQLAWPARDDPAVHTGPLTPGGGNCGDHCQWGHACFVTQTKKYHQVK